MNPRDLVKSEELVMNDRDGHELRGINSQKLRIAWKYQQSQQSKIGDCQPAIQTRDNSKREIASAFDTHAKLGKENDQSDGERCLCGCHSLGSITFESGSKFRRSEADLLVECDSE
jgi:hypothetical protein